MSTFAPVYRPTKHQQTFFIRREKAESRKRKRDGSSSDEGDSPTKDLRSPEQARELRPASSTLHPVKVTDPYNIAGHPREEPLPPPPFPHAAFKEASRSKRPVEEELAALNPPLYTRPSTSEDRSNSLRRRHLDNVTAILHRCMLNGDWERAHRAWSLLIRTEIAGRGIDVRRNGRWDSWVLK